MANNHSIQFVLITVLMLTTVSALEPELDPEPLDSDQLIRILQETTEDWNRGDLEGFLAPYDSNCTYMSHSGPIGWEQMATHYRESYFKSEGQVRELRFEQIEVQELGTNHALMTGRYVLSGGVDPEQSGWFTLVWVRRSQGWKILHDHSS